MRTLLLLLLCTLSLVAKDSPEDILGPLPDKIAGCDKGELHKYEQSGLGASTTYKEPGLIVTVYAYDFGIEKIADGLEDKAVLKAFKDALSDIETAKKEGNYSEVTAIPRRR